jgi:hypothetical protein
LCLRSEFLEFLRVFIFWLFMFVVSQVDTNALWFIDSRVVDLHNNSNKLNFVRFSFLLYSDCIIKIKSIKSG